MRLRALIGFGAVALAVLLPGAAGADDGAGSDRRGDTTAVTARPATEATAPAVERRLRTELGARFGGAWMAADGRLIAGVTDAASVDEVRAAGAVPRVVARSQQHLDRAKARLDAKHEAAPAAVSGWYVDLPTNSLVVQVAGARPGQLAAAREFLEATGVGASGRVVATAERPRLFHDVRGGDAFFIGNSRCSAGFAVHGGFLTAGHCARLASGQLTGSNGVPMGTWGGSAFPVDDHAWVRTNANWNPLPEVTGLGPVAGSQEAVVGASVCRSGSTTGVRCGVIQARNQTVVYPQGTVFGLTRTNACAEPGDSGGPFMAGNQAQGLTSGGNGSCASGGTTYFQPVNEALNAYGLALRTANSGWRGWTEVPGGRLTPSGPAAVTFLNNEYVFVRGTDDRVYVNRFDGIAWSGWSEVPGGASTPNRPGVAVLGGALHLFVRGTDQRIYQNTFNGSAWSGWAEVGGRTPSDPEAVVYDGALHLFIRGTDDHIYVNRRTGATWSGWTEVGGLTVSGPGAVVLSDIHLIVRGTDQRVYENRFDGSTWSGWVEMTGGGSTAAEPEAVVFGGVPHVFIRGTDDHVYVNRRIGATWSGWTEVGGRTPSEPAAVAYGGALHLFVRGTDQLVHQNVFTG